MEFRGVIGVGADVGLEVHVAVGVVREAEVRAAVERRVIDPPGDLVETFHGAQPIAKRRVRQLPADIGAVHLPEHRGGGVVVLHPPHALCRHVPEWREILARHHVKYAVNSPFGTV